jgi:hypothetical protein
VSPICELRRLLAKRERKDFDAGIKEFNLKGQVLDRPLLPDELIHARLWNRNKTLPGADARAPLTLVELPSPAGAGTA